MEHRFQFSIPQKNVFLKFNTYFLFLIFLWNFLLTGEATRLWRFLMDNSSATLPPVWAQYLKMKTNLESNKNRKEVYSTKRDSSTQYQAWRKTIPVHTLTSIERDCVHVINALGYNIFGTIENTRDLSIPLFVNDTKLLPE